MNKHVKIPDIKYFCSTGGFVAPNGICGKVSVYRDEKGHRCTAHGNFKCKHKVIK